MLTARYNTSTGRSARNLIVRSGKEIVKESLAKITLILKFRKTIHMPNVMYSKE